MIAAFGIDFPLRLIGRRATPGDDVPPVRDRLYRYFSRLSELSFEIAEYSVSSCV